MRRRLFTICSGLSLLLFVAVCVLWARSYRQSDALRVTGLPVARYAVVYSGRGGLLVGMASMEPNFPSKIFYSSETDPDPAEGEPTGMLFNHLGFGIGVERPPYVIAAYAIWLPHWFALVGTAILPVVWLRARFRQHHRIRDGLCIACGYDLRASPDRCPECGNVVTNRETGHNLRI